MNNDDNFLYFLTEKMTKAKVYPPGELKQDLSVEEIIKGWKTLSNRINDDDYRDHKFGIYIHIPFCPNKCTFCYCPSTAERDFNLIEKYVDTLINEIDFYTPYLKNFKINSIYVGGGTPGYLPINLIEKLFRHLYDNFKIEKKEWQFNFESSPYVLTKEKLDLLKDLGVNRLSMGVQSMSGKVLRNISRDQSFDVLEKVINYSRKIGIKYVNLDYVTGLPGESLLSFVNGFMKIIKLRPEMIHLYAFCPTEETLFIKNGNIYNSENIKLRGEMQKIGEKIIKNAGYKEIKNDSWGLDNEARNKQETGRKEFPYSILGLGNYARSYIFKILYYRQLESPKNSSSHYQGHYINDEDEFKHFIMLAFRGGININDVKRIFKIDISKKYEKELEYLKTLKKIKREGNKIWMMPNNTNEYHFLLKKLFYSQEIINKLKDHYKDVYDSKIDYKAKLAKNFDENF